MKSPTHGSPLPKLGRAHIEVSPRLREAWYGRELDWEGSGMGEPIIGSDPEAFIGPKIKGAGMAEPKIGRGLV